MEDLYQGHLIRFGAALDSKTKHWTPTAMVFWNEGVNFRSVQILFELAFPTEKQAQRHAREFAMLWINAGKPEVRFS